MAAVTIRPAVDVTELEPVDTLVDQGVDTGGAPPAAAFPQSVASGGPTPTGVILWTRIAPDHYDPAEPLRLEVATDESFEEPLFRRELERPGVKPSDDFTVRVDLDGLLEPNRTYYYRFGYRGEQSQTGRCRTLPASDASPSDLRLGLLNCQNYQNGYFGAMAHLAEAEIDFVLHLGDYIYEHVADGYPNGANGPYRDRRIDLPDGETLPMSLDDFRCIYETYKTDPHLQRLHERHTVIQTWDDHAIANDRYWDYETDAPVFPEHPCGDVPEFTRYLTRAGIQAWWEFIPARITYDPDAKHIHDSFELYQAFQFGDLVTILLTDERLFRSEPLSLTDGLARWTRPDPSRTMLGTAQREWFLGELRERETLWMVWANAVLFKSLTLGKQWLTPWSDSWDGYQAERASILQTLRGLERGGTTSVVTLTGDMHTTLATLVRSDDVDRTPVAVEFMTPGVTSVNFSEKVAAMAAELLGHDVPSRFVGRWAPQILGTLLKRLNADFDFLDSAHWGYSIINFTRDACTWDVYWVDKTVNSATATCTPVYRVSVPTDMYKIRDLSHELTDPDGGH